jgi:hypothetical protein
VLGAPVSLRHAAGGLGSPQITTRTAQPAPVAEPASAPRPADQLHLQPTRAPPAS